MTNHECPVVGCRAMVPRTKLMCAPHWRLVPAELRRLLTAAWRGGQWSEYFAYRERAIDAVVEKAGAR